MKILIYTHEFPPFLGGLATTSYKLAKGFAAAGAYVTVLAPEYSAENKKQDEGYNFKVVRMTRLAKNHGVPSPVKEAAGYFSLKKTLSQIKPDIVFFITREAHAAGGLLTEFPFKVIVRVAGYEAIRFLLGKRLSRKILAVPMRRLYMNAYKIISPSHSTRELLEQGGIPKEKIQVIYNGVNSTMLSNEPNPDLINKIKAQLGIGENEKVVTTISRLVPGKGQDRVIKALPKVLKEYDNFKYLVVGDGVYEQELKDLAVREGVESKVVFVGPVPHNEVINYYDLSDIFIMANITISKKENIEGLPNVVLEAASRRKPIITGVDGGGKEALIEGKSGYVLKGPSPDEIACYLLDLLKDDAKARAFGELGRQRIEEIFTEERMLREYLNLVGITPK